jgi:hypothetical protein
MCRCGRVTSAQTLVRMCLDLVLNYIDDVGMDPNDRIFRHACSVCHRRALTFDEQDRPICSRNAMVFAAARRVLDKDDE